MIDYLEDYKSFLYSEYRKKHTNKKEIVNKLNGVNSLINRINAPDNVPTTNHFAVDKIIYCIISLLLVLLLIFN